MAVTTRMRFEILKRDGFKCRYCNAADVELQVDHVVPQALGGSDDASNLVAACIDCNIGKASTSLDAPVVEDIATGAEEYAEELRSAIAEAVTEAVGPSDSVQRFREEWDAQTWAPIDGDHAASIAVWLKRGMTIEQLIALIPLAMRSDVHNFDTWRYYCGVVWNTIRRAQERLDDSHQDAQT